MKRIECETSNKTVRQHDTGKFLDLNALSKRASNDLLLIITEDAEDFGIGQVVGCANAIVTVVAVEDVFPLET